MTRILLAPIESELQLQGNPHVSQTQEPLILGRLFIGERLGTIQRIAIALSFAGIAWLVGSS